MVFRAVLRAFAEPGLIVPAPFRSFFSQPVEPVVLTALALTFCDSKTTVNFSGSLAGLYPYLAFHAGSAQESPERADFVFCGSPDELPPLKELSMGTELRPDLSALVAARLKGGGGGRFQATGPGIKENRIIEDVGLPSSFVKEREALAVLLPQGLDFIFALEEAVLALPRTTRLREL
jgi:alpha-D-ribose 1-methylphosphonate 5-triphosphate synthase subunit PhnH